MALQLGQIRRSSLTGFSYISGLSFQRATYSTKVPGIESAFSDFAIQVNTAEAMLNGKSLYLFLEIQKKASEVQTIKIYLRNTNDRDGEIQELKTIEIPSGTDYHPIELIISPNASYNFIVFELQRKSSDYQQPRVLTVRDTIKLYNINNIRTSLGGVDKIKKLGIQGAPGFLMCINGEEIRVGKSGIYELLDGVYVTFIGFIIDPTSKEQFIMDYQY